MNILKRMASLLPIIVMGMMLAFLLPNNLKAWNPVYDLDFRFLFLFALAVAPYVVGFATIKNLIRQNDQKILKHLDLLMICVSVLFGMVVGMLPYCYLPSLRSCQSVIWAVFVLTSLFAVGKTYFIFRRQNADVVLLSIC